MNGDDVNALHGAMLPAIGKEIPHRSKYVKQP